MPRMAACPQGTCVETVGLHTCCPVPLPPWCHPGGQMWTGLQWLPQPGTHNVTLAGDHIVPISARERG